MLDCLDLTLLGQRLREARKQLGLSQKQVGERIGAAASWISDLEKGKQSSIAADTVRRLCLALGCSADTLLDLPPPRRRRTDDPTPPKRPRPRKAAPVA